MASRFACIATSRRRRALTTSLSSPAVRRRRAIASLRRATGAWQELGGASGQQGQADVPQAPEHAPSPAIVSRR
jgi:hypothetical protein